MKPLHALLLTLILPLVGVIGAGCITAETLDTCEDFDDYLLICHFNCEDRAAFRCEEALELKDSATRELLAGCAACLYEGAAADTCDDCTVDGYSCEGLLDTQLEVSCTE